MASVTWCFNMIDLDRTDPPRRNPINWRERITALESRQIDPVRFAQIEAKLNQFCDLFLKNNENHQNSQIRNAEANERIAAHFEESRRVWERVEELQESLQALEKIIIELREQHRQMQDFSTGVKKAAWIAVTCGGIILWWIIQKWVDNHVG